MKRFLARCRAAISWQIPKRVLRTLLILIVFLGLTATAAFAIWDGEGTVGANLMNILA